MLHELCVYLKALSLSTSKPSWVLTLRAPRLSRVNTAWVTWSAISTSSSWSMSAAETANFLKSHTKSTRKSSSESADLVVKLQRWTPFTRPESNSTKTSLPTTRRTQNSVQQEDQARVPLRKTCKMPLIKPLERAREKESEGISESRRRLLHNKLKLWKKRKRELNVLLTLMSKSLLSMPSVCRSLIPISVSYRSCFFFILLMIHYFLSLPLTLWDET